MAIIISADEIKKTLPNYSPAKSEFFHSESAKLADKLFYQELNKSKDESVILLNGGTASGKSEFLSTQLANKECIILYATLSTEKGAKIKLQRIVKADKKPIVYSVIPDDLKRAFTAFLGRERKFSDDHFYETHSGSRKTLLWIAQNYSDVEINIIESSYTKSQTLQFIKIAYKNRKKLVEYLINIQMTEDDIIKQVI